MILKFTPNFTSRIHGLFADTEYVLSAVTKPIIKEKGKEYFKNLFGSDPDSREIANIFSSDLSTSERYDKLVDYFFHKQELHFGFDPWYGIGDIFLKPHWTKAIEVEPLCPEVEKMTRYLFNYLESGHFGKSEIFEPSVSIAKNMKLGEKELTFLKQSSPSYF